MAKKELERVIILEERGHSSGPLRFKKVEIKYSDGELFYRGWIQDFGDERTGPTFFERNYKNFDLDREFVVKREKYWQTLPCNPASGRVRDAIADDLDDVIDLSFQNYFDGGYNRISAYQGLNHKIDTSHITLATTIDESIFAYLYVDLSKAFQGEAYFNSLYCAPAIRRKGIGYELLAAGLNRVKDVGLEKVSGKIVGTFSHCKQIAEMLDKHGFEVAEYVENDSDWYDVIMVKHLSRGRGIS